MKIYDATNDPDVVGYFQFAARFRELFTIQDTKENIMKNWVGRAEYNKLRDELEQARVQLAACSVAALQNTPNSIEPTFHTRTEEVMRIYIRALEREIDQLKPKEPTE